MNEMFGKKSKQAKQTGLFGMPVKEIVIDDEDMQITEAKKEQRTAFVPWIEK